MKKTDLRQQYKKKRAALSATALEEKSMAIANQSLKLPIWKKSVYHLFLTIEKQKEVDTQYLLRILYGRDKNITVSKSDFATHGMRHFLLTDATRLRQNAYGIPEPQNGFEIQPQQIDVVFVPLLAYDKTGHRIGYGGGFYDRFLSQCRPETLKVGLSFFPPEDRVVHEENDIPLDYCITPDTFYAFAD